MRFRVLPVVIYYDWDPLYICDTDKEADSLRYLGIPFRQILVTYLSSSANGQGAAKARNHAIQQVIPKDEWSIWIDDNVSKITGLNQIDTKDIPRQDILNNSSYWKDLFSKTLTPGVMDEYIKKSIEQAEKQKTIMCGFATENNPLFRAKEWRTLGYCRTQFCLYKNDGSTWFPFPSLMIEDLYKSVDVVARYGSVVINQFVKPVKRPFEIGGIGSFEERIPWLQENCKKIAEMFPGLVELTGNGKQYGVPEAKDFHLKFVFRTLNKVQQWRKEHGYAPLS